MDAADAPLVTVEGPMRAALEEAASLAARVCGAPMAVVSLAGVERQVIAASVGDGSLSLAAPVISEAAASPPVAVGSGYAGAALTNSAGQVVGTLCVFDERREAFDGDTIAALVSLGHQVARQIELASLVEAQDDEIIDLRAANERLTRAGVLQTHIAGITGHELRTPLTGLGAIDMLAGQWDSLTETDRRRLLEVSQRAAKRVRDVASTLLQVAESSAAIVAAPQVLALDSFLPLVVADTEVDYVEVRCPPEATAWVTPGHLAQIVTNLVMNAGRYGSPPITVAASPEEGRVRITVKDAGPGIDRETVARMFKPYQRGDQPSAHSMGLGLAIVLELVSANDGTVGYERPAAGGSEFVVTLPAVRPN